MIPDETPDERVELLDLLASLRTDGVEPDPETLQRAREVGITDHEIQQRAGTMRRIRTDLGALADREAAVLAEDELDVLRSAQQAIELGRPEPASPSTPSRARRARRIPSPMVALAAATVIIAGVGLGGWIVAQDTSEQLASNEAGRTSDAAASGPDATEESEDAPPALPPDVAVIGTAMTPDEAIELAEQHWATSRTSSTGDASTGLDGTGEAADDQGSSPATAAGPDTDDGDLCGATSDPARVVVIVIDDAPHLVVRDADGAIVVFRVVDCREVGRA